MDSLLEGLNEQQKEAVLTTEGYVRVIAGAGSGKTKTLVHRYVYIVRELGVSPSSILCLTFTNKAAKEMRDRVSNYINMQFQNDYISTFHSFCVRILRSDIHRLGYPAKFVIIDEDDQKALLRQIYETLDIKQKDISLNQMIAFISSQKVTTEYIEKIIFGEQGEIYRPEKDNDFYKVFREYVKRQHKLKVLDFNDLMLFSVYIFNRFPEVLQKWQNTFDYIMVDETQDNDSVQWELIDMLQKRCKNLFVVGDPDQCIYEWRNADPDILVNLDRTYPDCKTIILHQNYRSIPNILYSANSVIKNNKNRVVKDLTTNKTETEKIVYYHAPDEEAEGKFIVWRIEDHVDNGGNFSDIAILIRAAFVSRFIEQYFIKNKIPYTIYGGIRFFERMEVKDVLAYLRLLVYEDDLSFLRVVNKPKRKLGKKFIDDVKLLSVKDGTSLYETLKNHISDKKFAKQEAVDFVNLIESSKQLFEEMSLYEATREFVKQTGLSQYYIHENEDERVNNINELINYISLYEDEHKDDDNLNLTTFLQDIALYTNLDKERDSDDIVKIMTIHQSKGLEFPVVFVSGLTEGIIPNSKVMGDSSSRGLEEERRLMYVAMTRAENKLYLTESEGFFFGQYPKIPSRFIEEIPEDLMDKKGRYSQELIEMIEKLKSEEESDDWDSL